MNFGKTIIIPLWPERSYDSIRQTLHELGPNWSKVQIQGKAKYLGFWVGPDRDDSAWDKAATKWEQRSRAWSGKGVGLQYSAMVYNTFCASVLSFLGQLLPPPIGVLQKEPRVMRMMASGPNEWANATDLWNMGERCSIGRSFHSILATSKAAQLRITYWENWDTSIEQEHEWLQQWRRTAKFPERSFIWAKWLNQAYVVNLCNNVAELKKQGITRNSVRMALTKGDSRLERREHLRTKFQKEATRQIMKHYQGNWEARVEKKLQRWNICGIRRFYRDRFIRNIASLSKLVAPRVAAAVWGLAWNRWCTARRFQKQDKCYLGCGKGEEGIEHYMGCATARLLGKRKLGDKHRIT